MKGTKMEIGNLSNLSVRLQEIEVGLGNEGSSGLNDARLALVNALEQYRKSVRPAKAGMNSG